MQTGQATPGPTGDPTVAAGPDQAVDAYFRAANTGDLDALVAAFTPTAEVVDVGRSIVGAAEIRRWADNEVLGGRYDVLGRTRRGESLEVLVRFTPEGAAGFQARYSFEFRGGRIQRAVLTYA